MTHNQSNGIKGYSNLNWLRCLSMNRAKWSFLKPGASNKKSSEKSRFSLLFLLISQSLLCFFFCFFLCPILSFYYLIAFECAQNSRTVNVLNLSIVENRSARTTFKMSSRVKKKGLWFSQPLQHFNRLNFNE